MRQVRHSPHKYFRSVWHVAPIRLWDKILRKCLKKETKFVLKHHRMHEIAPLKKIRTPPPPPPSIALRLRSLNIAAPIEITWLRLCSKGLMKKNFKKTSGLMKKNPDL